MDSKKQEDSGLGWSFPTVELADKRKLELRVCADVNIPSSKALADKQERVRLVTATGLEGLVASKGLAVVNDPHTEKALIGENATMLRSKRDLERLNERLRERRIRVNLVH